MAGHTTSNRVNGVGNTDSLGLQLLSHLLHRVLCLRYGHAISGDNHHIGGIDHLDRGVSSACALYRSIFATNTGTAGTAPAAETPAADHAILFVSGAWSAQPDAPREIFAIAADGTNAQQLTTCGRAEQPCDILQIAPSPDRDRLVAVRTTPGAEPGAQFLYFMDLSRSVESVVFARRRVDSADWAKDGSFILFASPAPQTTNARFRPNSARADAILRAAPSVETPRS